MTLPWRRWTRDHRGRRVRLPGTVQIAFETHSAELSTGVKQRIKADLAASNNTWSAAAISCAWDFISHAVETISVVAAVIGIAVMLLRLFSGQSPLAGAVLLAGAAVLLGLHILADTWIRGAGRRAVIQAFLRQSLCPSCSYEIKTARPEADGCVVCPECGAAWRLALRGAHTDPETRLWSGETG